MQYAIVSGGESRSFPPEDRFLTGAAPRGKAAAVVYLGGAQLEEDDAAAVILVELGLECLGEHTGEVLGEEGSNIVGFARYRNGANRPSTLVELVKQKNTSAEALAAAKAVFETAGLTAVVCTDQPGRIIDRLVRPKYNAALRFLDECLATQKDIDMTCRLGLGYPDGPIERVIGGGLADHYDICTALFETFGTPGFAPARRAVVAAKRREAGR